MKRKPGERSPDEARMVKMTRRALLSSVGYFGLIGGVLYWLDTSKESDGVISPLRTVLEFNRRVWSGLFSPNRRAPTYSKDRVTPERLNETIGMEEDLDPDSWRLSIEGVRGSAKPVSLTMHDIRSMPAMEMTTEFCCIEGWSVIQTWKGVSLREFMKVHPPPTLSGKPPDLDHDQSDLVPYVAMETPNGGYYIGLDMASAIHEQTMLCYEMNGKPLTEEHGAPLRLIIPVKYGIKNLKRLGKIRYATDRPKDYWAEQGYDWYAGL